MKAISKNVFCLLVLVGFMSCSDYLDKLPSATNGTPITEVSQLFALYDVPSDTYEKYNYAAEFMHDDTEITREMFLSSNGVNTFEMTRCIPYYTANNELLADRTADQYWTNEYSRIYKANVILYYYDKVEGDRQLALEAAANAYLTRAYSFHSMSIYYCRPYCEANKNELGIPLRLATDFEEAIDRGTLQNTYNQILSDIKSAENIISTERVDAQRPWRASLCAVYALYARVYLSMNDYDNALLYAEKALQIAPELQDYNNLTYAAPLNADDETGQHRLAICETYRWYASEFNTWKDFIYTRLVMAKDWWIPSKSLLDTYDPVLDLRYDFFVVEDYNHWKNLGATAPAFAQFGQGMYVQSGLTTAEMYLIKAECMVRKGQWQEGLDVLLPLRQKRFRHGISIPLTADSQEEALREVLAERRREMPFTARLGDIKRFSVNSDPNDDVVIKREFFEIVNNTVNTNAPITYTLEGNSPRLAMPIFSTDITASNGALQQYPYE